MHKIGIVVCYFGQWPRWFNLFLETCAHNPSIQFFFFTDCGTPARTADNLAFIPFTMADFNALAAHKTGLPVTLPRPYKVGDIKPAYGVMFEEYLREFDFWGYCDVDLIYGNIRKFITEDVLETYDVIASRKEYMTGHFNLYRNTEPIRHLYRESADYEKVFLSDTHYFFEECNRLWRYLLQGGALFETTSEVESMTHVVRRLDRQGTLRASFAPRAREKMDVQQPAWKVCWDRGRLIDVRRGEEIMYFHFHVIKYAEHFKIPTWSLIPDAFCVTEDGFAIEWMSVKRKT